MKKASSTTKFGSCLTMLCGFCVLLLACGADKPASEASVDEEHLKTVHQADLGDAPPDTDVLACQAPLSPEVEYCQFLSCRELCGDNYDDFAPGCGDPELLREL